MRRDLKTMGNKLARYGRGKDTLLAHITPREAEVLKRMGGAGTANPVTGLLEFYLKGDSAPAEETAQPAGLMTWGAY